MDKKTYRQKVKNLKEVIYGTPYDQVQNLGLLGTFSLISANLLRFLNLKDDVHFTMVQDIQFHRSLSNVDQHCIHTLDELKFRGDKDAIESKKDKGDIFVTFHTGSYRLFILHLQRIGVPFCLVTEGKYIQDQGETSHNLLKGLSAEGKDVEILEAENPRLLFELVNKIKNGISVVFFIDGNTGSSDKKVSENKNLLKIDFLDAQIYARQGIAMLSYLTKAEIVLALTKRNVDLTNTITIKKINTKKYEKATRTDFVNGVTQSLFTHLEHFLRKFPEQWEGWFYIQKFFEQETHDVEDNSNQIEKYPGENEIKLEVDQHIQLVKYNDNNVFVIHKKDYQIMKITPLLYNVLNHFKTPKKIITNTDTIIDDQTIEWGFLEELIEMDFLSA